jgi:formate hydrogenlyase transcriptional activator
MGRTIEQIPAATLRAVSSHDWPGNVRELQNVLERAMNLAKDGVLHNPLPAAGQHNGPTPFAPTTLQNLLDWEEREFILGALKAANWVVGGAEGAAARLKFEADRPGLQDAKTGHFAPAQSDGSDFDRTG